MFEVNFRFRVGPYSHHPGWHVAHGLHAAQDAMNAAQHKIINLLKHYEIFL